MLARTWHAEKKGYKGEDVSENTACFIIYAMLTVDDNYNILQAPGSLSPGMGSLINQESTLLLPPQIPFVSKKDGVDVHQPSFF